MATVTGAWAGSGNAVGRLIIVYTTSSTSTSTTFDITLKCEVKYSVSDSDNTLTRSGSLFDGGSSSIDLSVPSNGTKTIWSGTKTVSKTASRQTKSMKWTLSGVNYWGETATVSTNVTIDPVPAPSTPSSVSISRESLTSVKISWGGGTAHHVQVRKRGVDGSNSAAWGDWINVSSEGSSVSSGSTFAVAGDRDYQARVRRKNSVGVWSNYGTSSNTARMYDAPNAPTSASVTRTNDSSHLISFVGSSANGKPILTGVVERWTQSSDTWSTPSGAGSLASTTRSFRDTTNLANNRVRWRVKFTNSAGSSGYAYTDYVYTTPTAPTTVAATVASVSGGTATAKITWKNTARAAQTILVQGQSSSDGGKTFGGWSTLATVSSSTTTTNVGVSSTLRWRFRVVARVTSPATLDAASSTSNVIVPLVAPKAATPLGPLALQVSGEQIDFTWKHNPIDSSAQTAAQVRYRLQGTETYTTIQVNASTAQAVLAAGLGIGTWEWSVRTKGLAVDYGPWSSTVVFQVAEPPSATILTPLEGTVLAGNRLTVTFDYADAQGAAMTGWTRRLINQDGQTVEEVSGTTSLLVGGVRTAVFTTQLTNEQTYTAQIEVLSGTGLRSDPASVTITTDFTAPAQPIIEAEWNEDEGVSQLGINNTPGGHAVEVRRNLALNPRYASGGTGVPTNNSSANWTLTRYAPLPSPTPDGITTGTKSQVAASASSRHILSAYNLDGLSNTSGVTRSVGAWVWVSGDGYGIGLGADYQSATIWTPLPAQTWTWVTSGSRPALGNAFSSAQVSKLVSSELAGAEDVAYITGITTCEGSVPPATFFDGSYSPDPDLTPAWTGTANASASTLTTAPTVDTATNRIERSEDGGDTWVTVADGLPDSSQVTDNAATLNADPLVCYRDVAISELGVETPSEPVCIETPSLDAWITWNDGSDDHALKMECDISLDGSMEELSISHRLSGRQLPVAVYPMDEDDRPNRTIAVSAMLKDIRLNQVENILRSIMRQPFRWRDHQQRNFKARMLGPSVAWNYGYPIVSFTVEENAEMSDTSYGGDNAG